MKNKRVTSNDTQLLHKVLEYICIELDADIENGLRQCNHGCPVYECMGIKEAQEYGDVANCPFHNDGAGMERFLRDRGFGKEEGGR